MTRLERLLQSAREESLLNSRYADLCRPGAVLRYGTRGEELKKWRILNAAYWREERK